MDFLQKLKNGFINAICLLLISFMGCMYAVSRDMGGLEINGFLAFLLWIFLVAVLVKFSGIISVIISISAYLIIYALKIGVDEYWTSILLLFIALFVILKYLKRRP